MHDLEPFWNWRDRYMAEEDERSPFYGREYSEFYFTQQIYNYVIHPQWDAFGSKTLYTKLLWADYDAGFAILEMLGEWNDCLYNDIMFLKREVIDPLQAEGIHKFVLVCENVLNFHGLDTDYYEEWFEEVSEADGWICFINVLQHVEDELKQTRLHDYLYFGGALNDFNWRPLKPEFILYVLEEYLSGRNLALPGF